MLFGKPTSIDDCLDLAQRQLPKAVEVILASLENVTGMYLIKRLKGMFVWDFEDGEITVGIIFGGFFWDECEKQQKKSIDIANHLLRIVIHKIESRHIQVIGKDVQFKNSLIYKWGEK